MLQFGVPRARDQTNEMIEYQGNKDFAGRRKRSAPPPPIPERSPWLWLGSNAAWMVLGGVAFALLTAALSFGVGVANAVGFLSPALALIFLSAVAAFTSAVRRGQARRVLAYVHQAVRLNLPIPDMLAAAAAGEAGRMRYRLLRLRDYLLDGLALSYAIELAAPGVESRLVAAVAAGEHLGRLPEALDRVVAEGTGGGGRFAAH